jgi:hypothetical protein
VPTEIEVIVTGTPDSNASNIPNGSYVVINLGSDQIQVVGSSEVNLYDMVYYQSPAGSGILMDQVIIAISQNSNGGDYYTVFYWGDGTADLNSNVGAVTVATGTENDNQSISTAYLYGTTGVAINIEGTVLSTPPVGWYQYVVIIVPNTGVDGNADIGDIQIIPEPTSAPSAPFSPMAAALPAQPAQEESSSPVEEVPIPPADNAPASPAEEVPAAPAVDSAPSSPADNAPAPAADSAPSSPANNAPAPAADNAPSAPANNAPAPAANSAPAPAANNAPAPAADNAPSLP